MSRADDDTPPPDAWLREALRHAPDAGAAPPPRLNDSILRMGRAAVAPPRVAPPPPSAAARFWAWLARPSVAAGFAGLMVATVAGVLWWGAPLDERGAPREEEAAPATMPAPTGTPAAPSAAPATDAAAPQAAKRAAPEAAREEAAVALRGRADSAERQAAPSADPAAPAAKALSEAAPGAALAGRAAASEPVAKPGLSDLRFAIQRRPEAWTWQRDDGERLPVDDALQEWIVRAERATRPGWVRGENRAASYPATLRFWRGGVLRVVLMVGPAGLQLTLGGKTESVELPPAQANALLSALGELGR